VACAECIENLSADTSWRTCTYKTENEKGEVQYNWFSCEGGILCLSKVDLSGSVLFKAAGFSICCVKSWRLIHSVFSTEFMNGCNKSTKLIVNLADEGDYFQIPAPAKACEKYSILFFKCRIKSVYCFS
jgi:hypothetical protein